MKTIDAITHALWPAPTDYTRELARKAIIAVAGELKAEHPEASAALMAEVGTEPRRIRQNRLYNTKSARGGQ